MQTAGLTADDCLRQAWLLLPDGRVYGGAEAINGALAFVWWGRPALFLYRLPGLRQLEDAAYRWVVRNRYRFPGVTPGCEAEFDCGDEE
jgi:predicted DCC family thiol-disulfide oxidoreductase YuxK